MVRTWARGAALWWLLVAGAGALTTTTMRRDADELRERVLHGLGLSRLPDPAKMNVSQEEYERMHRVYLQRVAENRGPQSEAVQQFYTIAHEGELAPLRGGAPAWLYLPVADVLPPGVDVDQAVLRTLVTTTSPGARLAAYQLLGGGRRLLDRRPLGAAPTWAELDVSEAARWWKRSNASNLGVQLACEHCGAAVVSLSPPVLNVLAEPGRARARRAAVHRAPCRNDRRCCRHSMEVVFKELKGFDFIVQPKKFDAGFCKGKCPPSFNPAHHHALIQSLVWKKNRQRAPKLCCAPYKLSDLEILHRDETDGSKLKVTKWDGMSVVDCKCS